MDDDGSEIVDHNDVKIIDDEDSQKRPLNRHEENLADLVINDQYGDENSSRF